MSKVYAKDLQPGDVLHPDDARVVSVNPTAQGIEVVLKLPRVRATTYVLDPHWELMKRLACALGLCLLVTSAHAANMWDEIIAQQQRQEIIDRLDDIAREQSETRLRMQTDQIEQDLQRELDRIDRNSWR